MLGLERKEKEINSESVENLNATAFTLL